MQSLFQSHQPHQAAAAEIERIGKLQTLHLARRAARQVVDKADHLRRLVAAEFATAEIAQLFFRAALAVAHDHARHDVLAVVPIGNADRGGVKHGRMTQQRLIDLARRDVLAALDDQFLDAAGDEVKAIRVAVAEVAGAQPAAGKERTRGGVGILVIARHHLRAANHDLANAAVRKRCAGLDRQRALRSLRLVRPSRSCAAAVRSDLKTPAPPFRSGPSSR